MLYLTLAELFGFHFAVHFIQILDDGFLDVDDFISALNELLSVGAVEVEELAVAFIDVYREHI